MRKGERSSQHRTAKTERTRSPAPETTRYVFSLLSAEKKGDIVGRGTISLKTHERSLLAGLEANPGWRRWLCSERFCREGEGEGEGDEGRGRKEGREKVRGWSRERRKGHGAPGGKLLNVATVLFAVYEGPFKAHRRSIAGSISYLEQLNNLLHD